MKLVSSYNSCCIQSNFITTQLCNGTRLVIKKITGNIIVATILTEKFNCVLLPRFPMIQSECMIEIELNEIKFENVYN